KSGSWAKVLQPNRSVTIQLIKVYNDLIDMCTKIRFSIFPYLGESILSKQQRCELIQAAAPALKLMRRTGRNIKAGVHACLLNCFGVFPGVAPGTSSRIFEFLTSVAYK